jgi:hypothetical protein
MACLVYMLPLSSPSDILAPVLTDMRGPTALEATNRHGSDLRKVGQSRDEKRQEGTLLTCPQGRHVLLSRPSL